MTVVPIRADNAYVGIAKQSAQGVPVAPTNFVRWLDGTKFEYALKAAQISEGDGTRRLAQLVKESQSVKATVVFNPRPIELGFFETAALGEGADTVTAPTVNTTLSSAVVTGATTISVAANAGLTGTGTIFLVLSPGLSVEEVASFTLPATGAGPYILTVANSGALKNAHSSGDTVEAQVTHAITDQYDGNYYTMEFGLGSLNGAAGATLRVTDCKLNTIKRMGKAGGLLEINAEFMGIATVLQGSPSTVVLERHSPFLYTQGTWTLDGANTGDALAIESIEIDQKNGVNGPQTEQLTMAALIFGMLEVTTKTKLVFQNTNLMALTYLGGGTSDAQAIGAGNLTVKFAQPDGFHTVQYAIGTLHYDKMTLPEPKKDGKYFTQEVDGYGVSNQGVNTNILAVTITNAQTTAY